MVKNKKPLFRIWQNYAMFHWTIDRVLHNRGKSVQYKRKKVKKKAIEKAEF